MPMSKYQVSTFFSTIEGRFLERHPDVWNMDRATQFTIVYHRVWVDEAMTIEVVRCRWRDGTTCSAMAMVRCRWRDNAITMTRWYDSAMAMVRWHDDELWQWRNALSRHRYRVIAPSLSTFTGAHFQMTSN